MIDEIRETYKQLFIDTYSFFKDQGFNDIYTITRPVVEKRVKSQFSNVDTQVLEGLALEMFEQFGGNFIHPKATVIRGEKFQDWFTTTPPRYRYFWPRYNRYLGEIKEWDQEIRDSIDSTTNEILKSMGNPKNEQDFDSRGLVLGYVQSGKTANFTGLINKAFDIGYKLVIVLAGMHNDLRSQTQIRLEEEVVGAIDEATKQKIGVAKIRNDGELVVTWTTRVKDITKEDSGKTQNFNVPNLLVVKKNKDVLESLKELLAQSIRLSKENANVPVLIIDDEADQASVDTSNTNKNEDPKTINLLIREILELFKKKSYVGYTATPFANLLINSNKQHDTAGIDLYPKDFVIALPKPKGYCGPEEYFNITGYEEDNKPLFIRHLGAEDLEIFDAMKKVTDADKFTKVPPSMKQAILSFLLTVAVRNLRGQIGKHNSMLIHTSRFTETQGVMQEVVNNFFEEVKTDILYNKRSDLLNVLENLYTTDFLIVQKEYNVELPVFTWDEVIKSIKSFIENIRVLEINGRSGQALEYQKYKDEGLNVIAIGGDKLSRGLTLEGLSISYYYRGTNMYDTLMQMGRWFGYRIGYMDLCRIYTSEPIAENFEHMARVMVELRKEFDHVAKTPGITPEKYAVRMLDHSKMNVTSLAKMGTADRMYDHGGMMRQTRILAAKELTLKNNMAVTNELISKIGSFEVNESDTTYYIAKNVSSDLIIEYLKSFETATTASKVNSKDIANYLERLNANNKLRKFNVVVVGDTKSTLKSKKIVSKRIKEFPVKLGSLNIQSAVIRAVEKSGLKGVATVDMGSIVASKQEFIDLSTSNQSERNKNNPAILIYPLHPEVNTFKELDFSFDKNFVPIGWALSFPEVYETYTNENGVVVEQTGNYVINKTVK